AGTPGPPPARSDSKPPSTPPPPLRSSSASPTTAASARTGASSPAARSPSATPTTTRPTSRGMRLTHLPPPGANLITWWETGGVAADLFDADVFVDLSLPHWRVQADTAEGLLAIR